ncbi:MAG: site-2 protease family protein [Candidatus Neptunochlamydia sp.]|nr:site-2 protease family protein [Candidatus Neptunochlamydia sp.]
MQSIIYIGLAILGLNFLVFIHELGHYILARRNGMKVEVFSIGFGKPLFSWMRGGVKWQVCPIFFGGYVRIAGMEKEGDLEPYEVPDGYYSKKPWVRIKVALAGPVVNLVFALVAFSAIWALKGRDKPFADFTQVIGYIDPHSELYQNGVRPGDVLSEYNEKPFEGYQDLVYAALVNGRPANLEGVKVDYFTQEKVSYDCTVTPYESSLTPKGIKTVGILAPASYLIYHSSLYDDLPLEHSGIEPHDRIVWMNGEILFSNAQLMQILNSNKVLLTVEREGKTFLGRVPRIPLNDLRLSHEEMVEIEDWKYEAGFYGKGESYLFIPYNLSYNLHVEKGLYYINDESKVARASSAMKTSPLDVMLHPGDRIIAVDGIPVDTPVAFLKEMQTPRVQIIVKRGENLDKISWKDEDHIFMTGTDWDNLLPISSTIGCENGVKTSGKFHLLNPVTPIRLIDFSMTEKERKDFDEKMEKQVAEAEKISDPEEREQVLSYLDTYQSRLMLGVALTDRTVNYNPDPMTLFENVFSEIAHNLTALFTGSLSPKQFGGPIFIMQVMRKSWGIGIKEAFFWLGAISLNLGILNLLPIPVLDGGHICFSILEKLRGKPLNAKTMQRLVIPFVVLLIFLFIYLTFNDITRIFGRFF